MKISAININQNTNFKGIWGGRSEEFGGNDAFSYCYTTYHYYPFADDTEEEITAAQRKYCSKFSQAWYETGGASVDTSDSVYVHDRLPFTAKEYYDYVAANHKPVENWSDAVKAVGAAFSALGLRHLLNKADKEVYDYEHAGVIKKFFMRLRKK